MELKLKKPSYKSSDLRKSNIYLRQNKTTGKMFAIYREENYQQTRTEKQSKARSEFGKKCHLVAQWLKDPENLRSETYSKAERAFQRQSHYSTMRGFLIGNAEKYDIL